jgi:hypothetical protein
MKSFFSVIASVLLLAGSASAQNFNIGVKAGWNIYEIATDNNLDYNTKSGLYAGVLGHVHLTDRFALQPELVYSNQGSQWGTGASNNKLILHYVNVPVLVQFMFDNGFRIQAGPQVGFLVNTNHKVNNVTTDIDHDNFKTLDFGVGFGASYVHPPTGFGVDARYNVGLSNINNVGMVNPANFKNRGLQLGLFYLFNYRS